MLGVQACTEPYNFYGNIRAVPTQARAAPSVDSLYLQDSQRTTYEAFARHYTKRSPSDPVV